MHKDEQQLEQRHSSLLALYKETWEEIRRLREFEWKIAATFVTLAGGFVVLISSDSFKPLLSYTVRWILTIAQAGAMVFGIYCLYKTHFFLTHQRNIRRAIENVLNFHEKGLFGEEPLLPAEWKGKITIAFQAVDLIAPLIATVLFVQALAIFITWMTPSGHRHGGCPPDCLSKRSRHFTDFKPSSLQFDLHDYENVEVMK